MHGNHRHKPSLPLIHLGGCLIGFSLGMFNYYFYDEVNLALKERDLSPFCQGELNLTEGRSY